jgi:hypothetical protein
MATMHHAPTMLHADSCILQAFDLGAQEVQLQAWGPSVQKLSSVAFDLAGIDPNRIVVSICTRASICCGHHASTTTSATNASSLAQT